MASTGVVREIDPQHPDFDSWEIRQNHEYGAESIRTSVPPAFADAVVTDPVIEAWVSDLVGIAESHPEWGPSPVISRGPSLLLLGDVGTGKTWAAYGAVKALAQSGARCRWEVHTEAALHGLLRPRPGVDTEEELGRLQKLGVLVIDDLGAAKDTDYSAEMIFRLVNFRYEWTKPTIITSNLLPKQLPQFLGVRLASRLRAMCTTVTFKGQDRRSS